MNGRELRSMRIEMGYRQSDLMKELGVNSRQTLSNWENADKDIPRLVELAALALKHHPEWRRILGKKVTSAERREYLAGRSDSP